MSEADPRVRVQVADCRTHVLLLTLAEGAEPSAAFAVRAKVEGDHRKAGPVQEREQSRHVLPVGPIPMAEHDPGMGAGAWDVPGGQLHSIRSSERDRLVREA